MEAKCKSTDITATREITAVCPAKQAMPGIPHARRLHNIIHAHSLRETTPHRQRLSATSFITLGKWAYSKACTFAANDSGVSPGSTGHTARKIAAPSS